MEQAPSSAPASAPWTRRLHAALMPDYTPQAAAYWWLAVVAGAGVLVWSLAWLVAQARTSDRAFSSSSSALIARGNDYPGNFSHVALLHVSPAGEIETVEAHIERGVVVAGIDRYVSDRKLRVMLLRPRADHPALRAHPALAHAAAERARHDALTRHITYDFEGNGRDPSQLFCSEVVAQAYGAEGVALWEGLTTTSDPDTARMLGAFGVREFETYGPSDLEYDPKLSVVAEWRDPEALFADHVDVAVIDALLEGARRGDTITHDWRMLPVARVIDCRRDALETCWSCYRSTTHASCRPASPAPRTSPSRSCRRPPPPATATRSAAATKRPARPSCGSSTATSAP